MSSPRTPLLRHRADRRALAMLAVVLAGLALPLLCEMPLWASVLLVPLNGWLCFLASVINHNHQHRAMFRIHWLNIGLNMVLTLARGHSATGIVPAHNHNHHRHHGDAHDWAAPALAGDGPGWRRLLRYVWLASITMARHRRQAMRHGLPRRLIVRIYAERAWLWAAIIAGLVTSPLPFALYVLLPWVLGLLILLAVNLLQHDGCTPTNSLQQSRDFIGAFGNWLLLNNGYHSAHHANPGLHWSALPQAHAALRDSHGGPLPHEQPSLPGFLWRHYIRQRNAL